MRLMLAGPDTGGPSARVYDACMYNQSLSIFVSGLRYLVHLCSGGGVVRPRRMEVPLAQVDDNPMTAPHAKYRDYL